MSRVFLQISLILLTTAVAVGMSIGIIQQASSVRYSQAMASGASVVPKPPKAYRYLLTKRELTLITVKDNHDVAFLAETMLSGETRVIILPYDDIARVGWSRKVEFTDSLAVEEFNSRLAGYHNFLGKARAAVSYPKKILFGDYSLVSTGSFTREEWESLFLHMYKVSTAIWTSGEYDSFPAFLRAPHTRLSR